MFGSLDVAGESGDGVVNGPSGVAVVDVSSGHPPKPQRRGNLELTLLLRLSHPVFLDPHFPS